MAVRSGDTRTRGPASAAVLALLMGLAAYVGVAIDRRARHPMNEPALVMCVAHGAAHNGRVTLSRDLLAAALLALDDDARAQLGLALDAANEEWAALTNPLYVSLDPSNPDAALAQFMSRAPAAVGVAVAASRETACAMDGLCARVAAQVCPPGFQEALGNDRERGRFLAWPYGYAVRMRAPTEARARELAALLRVRAANNTRMGLIVTAQDVADATAAHPTLASKWTKRIALSQYVKGEARGHAANHDGDGGDDSGAPEPVLLRIDGRDVVVMPRLTAILELGALTEDLRRIAPDAVISSALP
jgi:hypothetical protein